jgi:phage head maturation protease
VNRAYAFAEIKSVDEELREIHGWASRPETDRHGDVVEPMGMEAPKGTIPLLLDHDHKHAVGTVLKLTPQRDGVRFIARIAKIAAPGALKTLVDDAWSMVSHKLRSATSIGFKPVEMVPHGDGWKFKRWEILELSLVSVPAAAGATIDTIKAADRRLLAARAPRVVKLDGPVATAMLTEVERKVVPVEGVGRTTDMLIRMIAEGAKATDECLEQHDQRIARLEQLAVPQKDPLDMSPDEFCAHIRAQRKRLAA